MAVRGGGRAAAPAAAAPAASAAAGCAAAGRRPSGTPPPPWLGSAPAPGSPRATAWPGGRAARRRRARTAAPSGCRHAGAAGAAAGGAAGRQVGRKRRRKARKAAWHEMPPATAQSCLTVRATHPPQVAGQPSRAAGQVDPPDAAAPWRDTVRTPRVHHPGRTFMTCSTSLASGARSTKGEVRRPCGRPHARPWVRRSRQGLAWRVSWCSWQLPPEAQH